MARNRLLVVAAVCGAIVIVLLVVEAIDPAAPFLPIALVVGLAGAFIARMLVLTGRRK